MNSFLDMPLRWTGESVRTIAGKSAKVFHVAGIGHVGEANAWLGIIYHTPRYGQVGSASPAGSSSEVAFKGSMTSDVPHADVNVRRGPSGLRIVGPWRRGADGSATTVFLGRTRSGNWDWHHLYRFEWSIHPVSNTRTAIKCD